MSINLKKFEGALRFGLLGALLGGATLVSAVKADAAVVINEVYGGGGNAGATLKNDFIELYNNGDAPVDITGWTLQYASTGGTFSVAANTNATVLSGIIYPKEYFLVLEAPGAGTQVNNLVPDQSGALALSATGGKVALANNNVAVTSTVAPNSTFSANKVDFVGYGTATAYEGSGAAPATTAPTSVSRLVVGVDTNDNKNDFVLSTTPSPMNSSVIVATAVSPAVVTVTPNAPTDTVGATRAFTLTVRDGNGVGDINNVWFLTNTRLNWSDGATLIYDKASNQLYLRDGDTFSGPITPGSGTLSNNAVTIDGASVSVTALPDGKSLTLAFALQAKIGMVGTNNVWGRVQDQSNAVDPASPASDMGFVQKTTWTVNGTNGTQQTPSIALSAGAKGDTTNLTVGTEFTLNLDLTDPNGAGDLRNAYFLVNKPGMLNWAYGFTLVYDVRSNSLYLRSTDGNSFLGGALIGKSTGTLENEAGSVRLDGCTVSAITNGIHLSIPITPKGALAGTQQVWSHIEDSVPTVAADADASFGFKTEGTLLISRPQPVTPSASVQVAGAPAGLGTINGAVTGTETTFTLNLTDADGTGQLNSGWILINTENNLSWDNCITLIVDARSGTLYLRSTDGQSSVGGQVGTAATLENDAVSVRLSGSTLTRTAQGLSLVIAATPKAAFTGTKRIWSRVDDVNGQVQAGNDAAMGFNTEGQLVITAPVTTAPASSKPSIGFS